MQSVAEPNVWGGMPCYVGLGLAAHNIYIFTTIFFAASIFCDHSPHTFWELQAVPLPLLPFETLSLCSSKNLHPAA